MLCLIAVLFAVAACNRGKKVIEETYPDGSPKTERYYIGKGAMKEMIREVRYYSNHKKEMEGEYKNNKRNGNWVYYYKNGKKWSEGTFIDGLDNGKRNVYYENGQKRYEGYYDKGKESGIWKFWDEGGKLLKEINYDKIDTSAKK